MECHFREYRIKKRKKKRREGDSVSFVCFDTRSHPRKRAEGLCVCVCVCVCVVYRHTASTRDLLPSLCTIYSSSPHMYRRWPHLQWMKTEHSHNPAALCFSHHPLTILRGARWHFSPLTEPLWLGCSCVEPGRVGQLLSGLRLDLNPFFSVWKMRHLKTAR